VPCLGESFGVDLNCDHMMLSTRKLLHAFPHLSLAFTRWQHMCSCSYRSRYCSFYRWLLSCYAQHVC